MFRYGFRKKKITLIDDFSDFFMIGYEWKDKINYGVVDSLDELVSQEDVAFYENYFMMLDEKPADVYYGKDLIEKMLRRIRNITRKHSK